MELNKINELFRTSKLYNDFKDSNGVQLEIGDYIRLNTIHENAWIHQAVYRIYFNFMDGISYGIIGLYNEDNKMNEPEIIRSTTKLETDVNQWIMSSTLHELHPWSEGDGVIKWNNEYQPSKVYKVNILDEIHKIELSWSTMCRALEFIDKGFAALYRTDHETIENATKMLYSNLSKVKLEEL